MNKDEAVADCAETLGANVVECTECTDAGASTHRECLGWPMLVEDEDGDLRFGVVYVKRV